MNERIVRGWGRRAGAAGVALGMALLAAPAAAQEATVYATASVDGYDTNIALVGTSVRAGGLGLQPMASLQAYRLGYETSGTDVTVWALTPSVGLQQRFESGSLEARVGYSFQSQSEDDVGASPIVEGEGGGSGVVTAVQGNYWGGVPELQGIASFSWESDYLWSQAQALVPVASLGRGRLSVGAEGVWQGHLGDEGDYESNQIGPILKFSTGGNSAITVGGGRKDSNTNDPTWYARASFVVYGISL